MKRLALTTLLAATLATSGVASEPALTFTKLWTFNHGTTDETLGQLSEIPAFDQRTNTIWAVGIIGVLRRSDPWRQRPHEYRHGFRARVHRRQP
jgi:hypothetical protein